MDKYTPSIIQSISFFPEQKKSSGGLEPCKNAGSGGWRGAPLVA